MQFSLGVGGKTVFWLTNFDCMSSGWLPHQHHRYSVKVRRFSYQTHTLARSLFLPYILVLVYWPSFIFASLYVCLAAYAR